jgi:hypothetical protein
VITIPYSIRKEGGVWAIYNKDKKKIVGHSATKEMAKKAIAARYAHENGGK